MNYELRKRYIEAWNETMIKIWQERILALKVYESPRRPSRNGEQHLLDSLRSFPVQHDDRYMELTLRQSFLEYGIYQDLGVGREKPVGNSGDIGGTTQAGKPRKYRERRKWFSTKYYASTMRLKDFMAESIGEEFTAILSETLK